MGNGGMQRNITGHVMVPLGHLCECVIVSSLPTRSSALFEWVLRSVVFVVIGVSWWG